MESDAHVKEFPPSYVLITPAWNEAQFIERTLQSVVSQEVKPLKWIIVSDGSTDGTDDIVNKYAASFDWIELVRLPERPERHFAGKVNAFNAGYNRVRDLDFHFIANVDADVAFDADHFDFITRRFAEDATLGVAGTAYVEGDAVAYDYERVFDTRDVSGACQVFRRECFEEIGGYTPIKAGGIDLVAVYNARLKGWRTQTFTDKSFIHLRTRGTGQSGALHAHFRYGKQDYYLGSHPLWELLRAVYQMKRKPYLLVGVLLFSGYLWGFATRTKRAVSPELVAFRRDEQMQRLRGILKRLLRR